jgi:hypothetical protein
MENQLDVDVAASTASTPKLRRSVEDQAIENYIRDSERILQVARVNPDLSERLADYGFDDEELSRGMALQDAAWKAFCGRYGECPPERSGDIAELTSRVLAAREEFGDFRLVARAAFQNLSDRVTLRVIGDPPEDLQRFINAAFAGYETAGQEPYASKLAKRGFPPAKLQTLCAALDVLATLEAANEIADSSSDDDPDTAERDSAYVELKEFMKELKGVARAAFRKNPEALEKLGL